MFIARPIGSPARATPTWWCRGVLRIGGAVRCTSHADRVPAHRAREPELGGAAAPSHVRITGVRGIEDSERDIDDFVGGRFGCALARLHNVITRCVSSVRGGTV